MKNFKNLLLVSFLVAITFTSNAQKVAMKIGTNPATISPSAVLEIESTTKGLLLPRMTSAQRIAIVTPAMGLQVYDTTLNLVYTYNGTVWLTNWSSSGNAGTTPATNFIGTTDAQDLVLKTNNIEKMRVTSTGKVGIGTATPSRSLEIADEGLVRGVANSNYSNGSSSFGGVLALNSARGAKISPAALQSGDGLGSLTFNSYLTTGFNPTITPSGMTCFATQNHSDAASGTKLNFYTIPNNTTDGQIRMTIDQTGSVGIGASTPYAKLDVSGVILGRSSAYFSSDPSTVPIWRFDFNANNFSIGMLNPGPSGSSLIGGGNNFIFNSDTSPQVDRLYGTSSGLNWFSIDNKTTRVGIGTASPMEKLQVVANALDGWAGWFGGGVNGIYATNSSGINTGLATSGYGVWTDGSMFASGTYQGSDRRLKNDITPMNKMNALNTLVKLRPVSYTWKPEAMQAKSLHGIQYGLIAQEVQEILPGMVIEFEVPKIHDAANYVQSLNEKLGKTLALNYTELIPWLLAGTQELNTKIEEQQKQIEQQKNENEIQLKELKVLIEKQQSQIEELKAMIKAHK